MKHIRYFLIFLLTLFLGPTGVEAIKNTCTNSVRKQLATEATYIKTDYEIKDLSETKELEIDGKKTTYKIPKYNFEIAIYNLTDNLYAYISTTDPNNKKNITAYNKDAVDGVYTFVDSNIGDIYNYTISIRSNNPECPGATIRTLKFTKPRYNAFSEFAYCQNSSSFYCQRFIGSNLDITTSEFLERIKVNNNAANPKSNEVQEIINIFKKNWKMYLIIFFSIALAAVIIVFGIRYYNKKKGWRL